MITLTCNGDERHADAQVEGKITTGSVGLPVNVVLSDDFDGLATTVVFRAGEVERDVVYTGKRITVPPECLTQSGIALMLGVYATDAEGVRVIPTVWASAGTIRQGVRPSGVDPAEPTPSWPAQVQKIATDALAAAEAAQAEVDAWEEAASGWTAGARVESLDSTELEVTGSVVEALGTPAYVADPAELADYGVTEPGWYVLARVAAPDGAAVTEGTTVTGAAGSVAEPGADHVDVAVRFDVAAMAAAVAIAWDASHADAFVFRATDLAVRNLDYRTTFYVYDLAPFVTWEYDVASDATFVEGKAYWREEGDAYALVPVTEYTAGDQIPAWYEQVVTFQPTADATFVEGKAYYVLEGGAYVAATVTAGEPVPEGTYYEQATAYELTADATYQDGKAYWRRTGTAYAEATVEAGAPVPEVWYVHKKMVVGEGLTRNVTYRLDVPIDCPSEFRLPEVEDEEHGCWYEMRFRHTGSYSSTLTPPSPDVKVATQHTQAETEGINMVDLHYSAVAGAKVWRFMNTHSTFTADKPALESLAFRSAPATTEYAAGAVLDTTGAVVVATYGDGHTKVVAPTYSPANGAALTAEDTELTATYTEGGVTATATAPLTITGGE